MGKQSKAKKIKKKDLDKNVDEDLVRLVASMLINTVESGGEINIIDEDGNIYNLQ